jgi:hypothetical protein
MATAYVLTGKKLNKDWKGQRLQVVQSFLSTPEARTVADVTAFLVAHPKFNTVQNPERIAAYYLSLLNKEGYIRRTAEESTETLEKLLEMRDFFESKLDEVIAKIEALAVDAGAITEHLDEVTETVEN